MTRLIQSRDSKKTFNRLRPARGRRRGAVAVLVAGSMVVLCGMAALAVDYGLMVATKNQLQRSCDAAALGAVTYLPGGSAVNPVSLAQSNAKDGALYYAYENGNVQVYRDTDQFRGPDVGKPAPLPGDQKIGLPTVTVQDRDKISFPGYSSASPNTPLFRITVPAVRRVNFLFAAILPGIGRNGDVRARATAAVQLRDRLNSPAVAPIGITPETYAEGLKNGVSVDMRLIEQNKEGLGVNEMVAFDLRDGNNGKSPKQFEDQLKWDTSFNEPTVIGTKENTLNADDQAQSKAADDGIQSHFDSAARLGDNGNSYPNIPYGSARVVYMLLTPSTPSGINGTNLALVQGFVPVYLQTLTITTAKGDTEIVIRARMLPPNYDTGIKSSGGGYSDATVDSPLAPRIIRLVQ